MLKRIVPALFSIIVFSQLTMAQTKVIGLDVSPYLKSNRLNEIQPFYNAKKNETALVLREWSDLTLLVIDSLNKVKSVVSGQLPKVKPISIAGYSYANNVYTLYSLTPSKAVLGTTSFNLVTNKAKRKSGYVDLKREEKVLNYFSYKNDFYIISIFVKSSKLNLIKYNNGIETERKEFAFDDHLFPHFLSNNLYNCIFYEDPPVRSSKLFTPLVNSNSADYIEVLNDKLHIVSNTNTVVTIDLISNESRVHHFPIVHKQKGQELKGTPLKNLVKQDKTKSCVVGNHFFRINVFDKILDLEMYDLLTGELILDMILSPETEFINGFMNNEIFEDKKQLELTFEALRHGKLNFSVTKSLNHYNLKIGKKTSPKFWNRFDQAILNKKSETFDFDKGFVGFFYDQKEMFLNFNGSTPLFFCKDEERRIVELNIDEKGKILDLVDDGVKMFLSVPRFTDNPQLNSLFLRNNKHSFIQLKEDKQWIELYE